MPYSKKHKEASRQKILNSAVKLFSSCGFDQVSIDDLMSDAGLTRGAFYSHFKTKQALYSEAIIAGAKKSRLMESKPEKMNADEWVKFLLTGYISEEHINQTMSPCPLAFLVTDIANSEDEVKATYTRMYKLLNKAINSGLSKNVERREQDVFAATAMMIGGVAISRALNDSNLTDKLLKSCRDATLKLLQLNDLQAK